MSKELPEVMPDPLGLLALAYERARAADAARAAFGDTPTYIETVHAQHQREQAHTLAQIAHVAAYLADVRREEVADLGNVLRLSAAPAVDTDPACPNCGHPASDHYSRHVDLPALGRCSMCETRPPSKRCMTPAEVIHEAAEVASPCPTCGHAEGLHLGPSGCASCRRTGGLCDRAGRPVNERGHQQPGPVNLGAHHRRLRSVDDTLPAALRNRAPDDARRLRGDQPTGGEPA